eukprot:Sspe_Gene.46298::Locus_23093_Transcript_2_2_Confidence_0.667_Length_604::g.46298::m.46298
MGKAVPRRIKISNCSPNFDDAALKAMLGPELASDIETITWAVHRKGMEFAGFGWVVFHSQKGAKAALEFDSQGAKAQAGRDANEGNDLFLHIHSDEIPDGKCGWCGVDGHFAKECPKRRAGKVSAAAAPPAKKAKKRSADGAGGEGAKKPKKKPSVK